MGQLILICILMTPLIEIAGFIWVGGQIGVFSTLAAILGTALVGLVLVRWQGIGLMMDARAMTARGEVPSKQIAEAMMIGLAGILLVIPGFFSDLIGFVLLIPPVRSALFALLSRNMVVVSSYERSAPGGGRAAPKSIDLDPDDYRG